MVGGGRVKGGVGRWVVVGWVLVCEINPKTLILPKYIHLIPLVASFSPQPGSTVELSRSGYQFLQNLFVKYDKVGFNWRESPREYPLLPWLIGQRWHSLAPRAGGV